MAILAAIFIPVTGAVAGTGDILRGGFSSPTATGTAGNGSGSAATVAKLRANEADQLARTTQAVQAVQAMQAAARTVAAGGSNNLGMNPNNPSQQLPNVPNGLTTGGLVPAPGATANSSLWQNANLPTQSTTNGQTTVTIQQTAPKAILNWQTFNVGKSTTAYFNQSAGTKNGTNNWIALNRITDPTGVPSQILGSIKAEGQVYLINQNGIIFGGGSQVNVNTLVASTLNIPDVSFNEGFLAYSANNYNSSAVFSTSVGNAGPTAGNPFPAFSRFYQNSDTGVPTLPTNAPGGADVVVQPGSSITTSESGRVILLGAHVKNGGTISTPDGQTILAAGDSAYLYAEPTAQMRGLSVDVLIDPNTNNTKVNPLADPTAGTTTNSGLITVGKGNATLDGAIIAQNGVINALTGVDFNGSIILTARYAPDTVAEINNSGPHQLAGDYISPTIPGAVTLGPYSVTQILPDKSDPTTTLDAQGFNPSVIVAQGKTVALEGASFPGTPPIGSNGQAISPGALLIAPGGTVSVTAPVSYGVLNGDTSSFANVYFSGFSPFIPIYAASSAAGAGARIFIDNGATIDVSGTQDVLVPVSRNVVTVNLRANELRDSPLQRNGPLYGKNINVDITVTGTNPDGSTWYGTPFADASGYIALIGRTVAERTAIGGAINLVSAGDVVAVNGSTMNVSGGWLNYQSGIVATTRLLGTDGHLYDIANADPNLTYVGIAGSITITHPRWGVTETFNTPLVSSTDQRFVQGYLDGRSAGSIAITANKMILDGTLLGNSVSGPRQRTINANVDSSVPLGGSLTLQATPDMTNGSSYTNAIQDNLTFVTDHAFLTPDQALALADGTLSLSDPSIDRGQTLLLPVDIFWAGGFTTFSTEASTNIVSTNGVGQALTKTITTTSPFGGNVLLPQSVALDFGTAASATFNINYDGTVVRNADGTISTVSVNTSNSADVTVDAYGNVDLEGSITAPAGKMAFSAGVLYALKTAFDSSYLANPPSIKVG
jgi:filamentous hemagglutinin family protein